MQIIIKNKKKSLTLLALTNYLFFFYNFLFMMQCHFSCVMHSGGAGRYVIQSIKHNAGACSVNTVAMFPLAVSWNKSDTAAYPFHLKGLVTGDHLAFPQGANFRESV